MVTGASTANLAIVLVDARKGIIEQTKRHSLIASLLGIPHLAICINKMDLVSEQEQAALTDFLQIYRNIDYSIICISRYYVKFLVFIQ
jgi:sulfate adenylyltransferase subunit 1